MYVAWYAALWNTPSTPRPEFGGLREIIRPGAFAPALDAGPQTEFRLNHNGLALASTSDGTLRLKEDATGLRAFAYVANDDGGRQIFRAIQEGRCKGGSFLYSLNEAEIDCRANDVYHGRVARLVKVNALFDVTLCFGDRGPAYRATAGRVRAWPD